jgi:hypothetical protein
MIFIILIPLLLIIGIAWAVAYFISKITRKELLKAGNTYAKTISVIVFIGIFAIVATGVFCLIAYNFRIER